MAGVFYHSNGEVPDSWVAFSSDCGHQLCPVTSRIQLFSTSQLGAILSSRSVAQQLETYLLVSNRGVENTAVICALIPRKLLTSCNVHSPLYLFSPRCAESQLCDSLGYMSQDDCALESSMEGLILMLSVTTYKSSPENFGS